MGKKPKATDLVRPSGPAAPRDGNTSIDSDSTSLERREVRLEACSGPLPPAWFLEQYEQVIPGSAQRIFDRFEKQSDHRMTLERIVVVDGSRRAYLGQAAAFILSLVTIGGGIWLVHNGNDAAGAAIVGSNVAGLAYVFVRGRETQKEERQNKAQQMKDSG